MRRSSRLASVLRLLLLIPVLAGVASRAHAQSTGQPVIVSGRVVSTTSPGTGPVGCCTVEVTLHPVNPPGLPDSTVQTTTAPDGTFVAAVPCNFPPTTQGEVTAHPLCCGGTSPPVTVFGCSSPPTPPTTVDLGDVACLNAPFTGRTLIRGSVLCRRGPFLDPVADCSVLVQGATGAPLGMARTDASGRYGLCIPCVPTIPQVVTITAQCCGQQETVTLPLACAPYDAPNLVCDTCPAPACPNPTEVQITGLVVCPDPLGPDQPMPGCPVVIMTSGPDTNGDGVGDDCGPGITRVATTGTDGRFSACVPCPVSPDCASVEWSVRVNSQCCNATQLVQVEGCASSLAIPTLRCAAPCGVPRPCGVDGTRLYGQVTCTGPAGAIPVPNCAIQILSLSCPTSPPVSAVTDASGHWSACWPNCITCTSVRVMTCCGATRDVVLSGCPSEILTDISCTTCPPMRPCPDTPTGSQTQVTGVVMCQQGSGLATPIAACDVRLRWYLGTTTTFSGEAIVTTDGNGRYVACLPCNPTANFDLIRAEALCCGALTYTPVSSLTCPPTVELTPVVCTGCSPCPPNSTRLQGRVVCRSGRPVAGCPILVMVDTCTGGVQTFTATTDRNGKYALCIPCPCVRRTIRVTAGCCGATLTIVSTACHPVTPFPTLLCPTSCR